MLSRHSAGDINEIAAESGGSDFFSVLLQLVGMVGFPIWMLVVALLQFRHYKNLRPLLDRIPVLPTPLEEAYY